MPTNRLTDIQTVQNHLDPVYQYLRNVLKTWVHILPFAGGGEGIGKIRIFGSFSRKIIFSRGKHLGFWEKIVVNLEF